jgi:hypothetical protein
MSGISEILHSIFSDNAINAAAYAEQIEDVKYCSDHHLNHLNGTSEQKKWEEYCDIAEFYYANDEKSNKTYTIENMKRFHSLVNDFLKKHPKSSLYDGLTELEHYAVRRLYYYNSH